MPRSSCLHALALLSLLFPLTSAAAQRDPLAGFDAYVAKAMREWEVPGLSIGVVRNDSVVLLKGYGVREMGRPEPVDEGTMFAIASTSKAFTATLVGMLVDEGKAKWDDPVTRHFPGFELHDPYVTRELTLRDLLSHRSGLPRGDLLWYASPHDAAEVLRRVRFLRPSWSLRSHYGYQNIMYMAAGEVVGRLSGKPWEAVVRERLFTPLGMTGSNTSTSLLKGHPNVATPHDRVDDTLRTVAWRNFDNVGAAGAINSNTRDMVRWVRFQLDSARVDGRRLLKPATLIETRTPHTVIRRDSLARQANPYTHYNSYGLGWTLEDYRGREVVRHGGNLDGMTALVALMPGERVGVVVLSNMDGSGLPLALARRVFDLHLGVPDKDWSADLLRFQERARAEAKERERKKEAERVRGTRPSLPLAAYAGTYADSLYGEVRVRAEKGRLVAEFGPSFTGDLEHWHYNTFRARWRDRSLGRALVNFQLGMDGKPAVLVWENLGEFRRVKTNEPSPVSAR